MLFKFGKKKIPPVKFGLALGGGGTRGFAHIGVLDELTDAGVDFDVVAGTSAGSIVGAFYAAGFTCKEMTDICDELSVRDILGGGFVPFISRDPGRVEAFLDEYLRGATFAHLKKPFYAVSVDLTTGKQVILNEGSVARAVSASCAIPGVFRPVVAPDGAHLVDGGLLNNLPSDVARLHGADKVVAVDVNSTRGRGTDSLHMLEVVQAVIRIMSVNASLQGRLAADVLLCPELAEFSSNKKDGYLEMINIGRRTARENLNSILALKS
ncbi:MAG: patatin-like phospholipase family protein [Firmicutes bacterium]|nr:patatin-like phospholipase family protein [Bacillota bacterium]